MISDVEAALDTLPPPAPPGSLPQGRTIHLVISSAVSLPAVITEQASREAALPTPSPREQGRSQDPGRPEPPPLRLSVKRVSQQLRVKVHAPFRDRKPARSKLIISSVQSLSRV